MSAATSEAAIFELCDFGGISADVAEEYLREYGSVELAKEVLSGQLESATTVSKSNTHDHDHLHDFQESSFRRLLSALYELKGILRRFDSFSDDVQTGARLNRARCHLMRETQQIFTSYRQLAAEHCTKSSWGQMASREIVADDGDGRFQCSPLQMGSSPTSTVNDLIGLDNQLTANNIQDLQSVVADFEGNRTIDANSRQALQLCGLYICAVSAKKVLGRLLNHIHMCTSAECSLGPLKLPTRTLEKARADYNNNVLRVLDIVRASIVCEDFDMIEDIITLVERFSNHEIDDSRGANATSLDGEQHKIHIIRVKNSFESSFSVASYGYRDIKLNVWIPTCEHAEHAEHGALGQGFGSGSTTNNDSASTMGKGIVGEIQFHIRPFYRLKQTRGHKIYSWLRRFEIFAATNADVLLRYDCDTAEATTVLCISEALDAIATAADVTNTDPERYSFSCEQTDVDFSGIISDQAQRFGDGIHESDEKKSEIDDRDGECLFGPRLGVGVGVGPMSGYPVRDATPGTSDVDGGFIELSSIVAMEAGEGMGKGEGRSLRPPISLRSALSTRANAHGQVSCHDAIEATAGEAEIALAADIHAVDPSMEGMVEGMVEGMEGMTDIISNHTSPAALHEAIAREVEIVMNFQQYRLDDSDSFQRVVSTQYFRGHLHDFHHHIMGSFLDFFERHHAKTTENLALGRFEDIVIHFPDRAILAEEAMALIKEGLGDSQELIGYLQLLVKRLRYEGNIFFTEEIVDFYFGTLESVYSKDAAMFIVSFVDHYGGQSAWRGIATWLFGWIVRRRTKMNLSVLCRTPKKSMTHKSLSFALNTVAYTLYGAAFFAVVGAGLSPEPDEEEPPPRAHKVERVLLVLFLVLGPGLLRLCPPKNRKWFLLLLKWRAYLQAFGGRSHKLWFRNMLSKQFYFTVALACLIFLVLFFLSMERSHQFLDVVFMTVAILCCQVTCIVSGAALLPPRRALIVSRYIEVLATTRRALHTSAIVASILNLIFNLVVLGMFGDRSMMFGYYYLKIDFLARVSNAVVAFVPFWLLSDTFCFKWIEEYHNRDDFTYLLVHHTERARKTQRAFWFTLSVAVLLWLWLVWVMAGDGWTIASPLLTSQLCSLGTLSHRNNNTTNLSKSDGASFAAGDYKSLLQQSCEVELCQGMTLIANGCNQMMFWDNYRGIIEKLDSTMGVNSKGDYWLQVVDTQLNQLAIYNSSWMTKSGYASCVTNTTVGVFGEYKATALPAGCRSVFVVGGCVSASEPCHTSLRISTYARHLGAGAHMDCDHRKKFHIKDDYYSSPNFILLVVLLVVLHAVAAVFVVTEILSP